MERVRVCPKFNEFASVYQGVPGMSRRTFLLSGTGLE